MGAVWIESEALAALAALSTTIGRPRKTQAERNRDKRVSRLKRMRKDELIALLAEESDKEQS